MRFYLRPEPEGTIRGPYTLDEIRQSVRSGLIAPTAQALEATGQTLGQLRASQEWQAVAALVGNLSQEVPTAANASTFGVATPKTEAENRRRWVVALLISGILLVWFAGPISEFFVPKFALGSMTAWDPDTVRDLALGTRTVGLMVFIAGLVERVLMRVRPPGGGS